MANSVLAALVMGAPRPTRFLRLADGRAAQLTTRGAVPWPHGDHVPVTITVLDGGPEVDLLLPERWAERSDGDLRQPVGAAL